MDVRVLIASGRSVCRACKKKIPKGEKHIKIIPSQWEFETRLCMKHALELKDMLGATVTSIIQVAADLSRFNNLEVE